MPVQQKNVSLTTQTFWLMVARTLGFVFSFALPLLLVRVLNPSQIGIYRQCFLVLTTCINVLPMGMHVSAFYYLAGPVERRPKAVFNIALFLGTMGILAGGVLIVWPEVLRLIFTNPQILPYARLIGVLVFLLLVSSFLEIVATANQDVTFSTWFIIMAQLTKTIFMAGAALIFRSVEGVLYASLLQGVLQSIILLWYLNRIFPGFYRHFDFSLLRSQTSYAVPFGVAGLMYTAQSDYHSYLVAANVSPSSYALYSTGTAQLPLVNILRDSLNTVLMSRISGLAQDGEMEEIRRLIFRAVRKVLAFYLPVWSVLLLLGKELISILYTRQYLGSWPIFAINITILPFNALLSDAVLRSFPAYRFTALKIRLVVLLLTIGMSTLGFYQFGMMGAIAGATGGLILERLSLFGLILRVTGVRRRDLRQLSDIPKFALASALAFVAGALSRTLCSRMAPLAILIVAGSTFFTAFAAAVLSLGLLEEDERRFINSKTRQFLGRELLSEVRTKA